MFAFVSWLVSHEFCVHLHTIFLWHGKKYTLNTKYLLELLKGRSNVQEKNMSYEPELNVEHWKIFSANYKPIRVWL